MLWPTANTTLQTRFRHADGTDKMIGFRISDGKILKSPTYSDVDLSSFVEQAKASAMYGMIKK